MSGEEDGEGYGENEEEERQRTRPASRLSRMTRPKCTPVKEKLKEIVVRWNRSLGKSGFNLCFCTGSMTHQIVISDID